MEYTTAGYSMVCNAREDIEESTWVIPNHSYSLVFSYLPRLVRPCLKIPKVNIKKSSRCAIHGTKIPSISINQS